MVSVRVGLAGATGYLGAETARLLAQHPEIELVTATSTSAAGKRLGDVLPRYHGLINVPLVEPGANAFDGCDAVVLALPHGHAADLAPDLLDRGLRVVDLSGDHRLRDPVQCAAVYGQAPAALWKAVYGLPEMNRAALRKARLVANPGCYPTAATLALLPLAQAGFLSERTVVVDAKSGVSGAGREPRADLHYPEMHGSVRAYKVGAHRHEPEIGQNLGARVAFTPHLVPTSRGIQSTAYVLGDDLPSAEELAALYRKAYEGEPFVRVVPHEPDTALTRGTNLCDVRVHRTPHGVVATSAIDNLLKGGAGTAVHNLNLLFGLPETAGIPVLGGVAA